VLGPVDEVGHDEEVARKAHLNDGVALERKPRLVGGAGRLPLGLVGEALQQAFFKALHGEAAQVVLKALALGRGEVGQLRLAQLQGEAAALGHHEGIGQGLGKVGKGLGHLVLRGKVLLGREALDATGVGQRLAGGNTDPGLMAAKVFGMEVLNGMGGHHGNAKPLSEHQGLLIEGLLALASIALQLEVEPVAKVLQGPASRRFGLCE